MREWAGWLCAPHPSYHSSCGPVMCFLTWGWAGWSADTSRTGPWVLSCLSGARRIMNRNLFIWHNMGGRAVLHPACCLLSLLSEWLFLNAYVRSLLLYWPLKCFHVFMTICFIFTMRFGNSLDIALLDYQRDLVCLFSSEAEAAVGLKPGEHFNYNHSITTLCFKVRKVHCREGSGGGNACPK